MKPIFNLFWQICLMRRSPAQVPTYGWFVIAVVVANLVCSVIISTLLDGGLDPLRLTTAIVVAQSTTAMLVFGALALNDLTSRFVTTVTAIFGCDLIITACVGMVMPVSAVLGEMALLLTQILFVVWSIAVTGFILHRALDTSLPIGIGAGLLISLSSAAASQMAIGQ